MNFKIIPLTLALVSFQITEENIRVANEEYSGLIDIVMWSLPETLLQPLLHRLQLERVQKQNGEQITAKQFLFNSDPALRNVVAKEALQWRRGSVTQVCVDIFHFPTIKESFTYNGVKFLYFDVGRSHLEAQRKNPPFEFNRADCQCDSEAADIEYRVAKYFARTSL